MHVAVLGATGCVGSELVELLLAGGHDVRALVRDPSRLKRVHPHLVACPGDVLQGPGLSDVMDGADAVLSCLRAPDVVAQSARRIFEAAAGSGVGRAALLSLVGVGDS